MREIRLLLWVSFLSVILIGCNETDTKKLPKSELDFRELNFESSEIDLSQLPETDLKFDELPSEIQRRYIRTFGKNIWSANFIVNLDSSMTTIEYKNTGKAGVRPGKKIFTIGGTNCIMPWNANKETPPFVLNKKKFYYRYTPTDGDMNLIDTTEIKNSNFRMVDLTDYLGY